MMYLISLCSVFSITIESGNLSEEWCLPMTCCSLYLLTKFSVNAKNDGKHPRAYAFIHGIMIGLMMLIRANNAFPVCAGIFFIGILLFIKKQYQNFFENIFFGFAGIFCVMIPVFGWFYVKGAFSEMIYAVFQLNEPNFNRIATP